MCNRYWMLNSPFVRKRDAILKVVAKFESKIAMLSSTADGPVMTRGCC
jgi:hypothetical protein